MIQKILLEQLSKDFDEYLTNGYGSDVEIHVGEYNDKTTFKAHSMILSARSPYFRKEIENIPQNSRKEIIEFNKPEISPSVFKPLLKYIYTGVVPIYNKDNCDFLDLILCFDEPLLSNNPNVVTDFILVANELELNDLVNHLQIIFIQERSEWLWENMHCIYARIFMQPALKKFQDFYKDMIQTNTELSFQLENFSKIPLNDVISMVSRDDLLMNEIEVWDQVIKWSVAQFPNIPQNPENWEPEHFSEIKVMLQNFVPLIRWFHISKDEFAEKVIPYDKALPGTLYQDLVKYHMNNRFRTEYSNLPKRAGRIDSKIIDVKHVSLISQWIKTQYQEKTKTKPLAYRYNLLIRGSQHGFEINDFRDSCKNKSSTLILLKLQGSDLIIGGYNPIPWLTEEKLNVSVKNSFIFTFNDRDGNPTEVGKFGQPKNKSYPLIYITDSGLKLGDDLYLEFTNYSKDKKEPTLYYHKIGYNLPDEIQQQIKNPATVEDYEVFSVNNMSALPISSLSNFQKFRRFMASFLSNSLVFLINTSVKFTNFLLSNNFFENLFQMILYLIKLGTLSIQIIVFELIPKLIVFGKNFAPIFMRWLETGNNFEDTKISLILFTVLNVFFFVVSFICSMIFDSIYYLKFLWVILNISFFIFVGIGIKRTL
ncbi:hypothetical protein Glove_74g245 [Diversispora epigaea]|uniref:BTB domain-containing protein n=1 Tax=Diversispora epigaea TaxID=1348612 RepID=A0A397JCJ4_9GLOM|nr:hypothetical protein Glove_74g245 [Diversispora epigaea]